MLSDPKWQKELKTEPWRQVLKEAANTLERIGWVQHWDGNPVFGMCASMALRYAAYSLELEYPGRAWTEAAMKFTQFTGERYIPDFNDHCEQTKENVIAQLRTCADA